MVQTGSQTDLKIAKPEPKSPLLKLSEMKSEVPNEIPSEQDSEVLKFKVCKDEGKPRPEKKKLEELIKEKKI